VTTSPAAAPRRSAPVAGVPARGASAGVELQSRSGVGDSVEPPSVHSPRARLCSREIWPQREGRFRWPSTPIPATGS
jgi:hypothetical protein